MTAKGGNWQHFPQAGSRPCKSLRVKTWCEKTIDPWDRAFGATGAKGGRDSIVRAIPG